MSEIVIKLENINKQYRLGEFGRGSLIKDIQSWWAKKCGKDDPNTRIIEQGKEQIYGDRIWALNDVSLEVNRGEVVGIIGKNGAGKSTLLKILSKVTLPTSGVAKIKGRIASLLEVGTGFHPELTGRENIYLNGTILGMNRAEINRKFDQILDFSGVAKYIDTPVKRYSSGMFVRLAFAVAAHMDPDILVVDEVLAVGDIEFQKKCLGKMEDVGKEGRTVLLVSHNMASIMNLCKRSVLLKSGEIVADGSSGYVVQKYLSSSQSAEGEVVWTDPKDAPGNDIARLHAVRILQDGFDSFTAHVDISKDINIVIEYWNLKQGEYLYPGIWLKDKMGVIVLASSNLTSFTLTKDKWYGEPYPCGLFKSICHIPGNFLNEGRYSISAIVGKIINIPVIIEEDIISFNVHDTGEMRKEYYGEWAGVVRVKLAWDTDYLGDR